jgi:hypothetical protein
MESLHLKYLKLAGMSGVYVKAVKKIRIVVDPPKLLIKRGSNLVS